MDGRSRSWKSLFTDVKSVKVKSGGRQDAVVQFESRALGHEVTVKFENVGDRALRFKLTDGPHGAVAWGELLLDPWEGGKKTLVRAALYMDVKGMAGWFIKDETIREMREKKLLSDLQDLAKRFPER